MNLVGLVGMKQSGKDTAAAGLLDQGWTRIALADPVREMALAIDPIVLLYPGRCRLSDLVEHLGWDKAKANPDVRRLLQRIGTEGVRQIFGENTWTDLAARRIGETLTPVVVTDIRFRSEAKWIRSLGGFVVRIVRPGQKNDDSHASEVEQKDIQPDYITFNDSTPEVLQRRLVDIATR